MNARPAIVAALFAFSWATSVHAEPLERGALRLEWSAPGGCPNGVEVVERVETLLGTPIASLRPEPILARGSVKLVEPLRFELELETIQSEQRFARSMQAPSCAELADAGALVLALAIDPTLAERQAHAAEATAPEAAASAPEPPPLVPAPIPLAAAPPAAAPPGRSLEAAEPRDDEPPSESRADGSSPVWAAGAGVVLDLGTVADVGFGPQVTFGAGLGRFRGELGALWLPPQRSVAALDPERGGDIDLVAGDVTGCFRPLLGTLEVAGCATVELGRLHGAGYGAEGTSDGTAFWLALGAELRGRLAVTRSLFATLQAGVLFSPQPTEFTLENVGLVHRIPTAVGRFGLAIETEFE